MEEGKKGAEQNYPPGFIDEQIKKGRSGNNQQKTGEVKLPDRMVQEIMDMGRVKASEVIPDQPPKTLPNPPPQSTPSPKKPK